MSETTTRPDAGAIRALVEAALADADRSGGAQLVSAVVPLGPGDPLAFFATSAGGDRFYWRQPARGVTVAGRGAVAVAEAKGPGRFAEIDQALADAFARLRTWPSATPAARGPAFVGGFAFADGEPTSGEWRAFPPARWVLPEVLVREDASGAHAVVSRCIVPEASLEAECAAFEALIDVAARGPGSLDDVLEADVDAEAEEEGADYAVHADRSHGVYRRQVSEALDAIAKGALDKVVLARSLEVRHPGRFGVEAFLGRLTATYPHCTTFAVGCGDDTLVAASPELLVRLEDDAVSSCALAGSAPRGRSPEEDEAFGRALAESPKEQAEHAAVVSAIREALEPLCDELSLPLTPELMRVEGIQHLATPVAGRLAHDAKRRSLLSLAERLHPTPAVGGLPDGASRAWIDEHEGLDRGWYAGPIGIVDASGGGELWVALRSALVCNAPAGDAAPASTARLFAGAGIVAGSEPEAELRETRLKLRALLAPLTEI